MVKAAVLVVDPAPLTARRVQEALLGWDVEVVVAPGQAEAEALMQSRDIAVGLIAASFPRGNGYDLARTLRVRHPTASVYLLCGAFEVFNAERARQVGVVGSISRPFTVEALRKHLSDALGPPPVPAEPARPTAETKVEPGPKADPKAEPKADPKAEPKAEPDVIPSLPSAMVTPLEGEEPVSLGPESIQPEPLPWVPAREERLATFLPQETANNAPLVRVDPDAISPAVEKAILDVLPEVVEAVLTRALQTSPAFRDLIAVAVDDAVRARIDAIARRVVRERLEQEKGGR